MAYVFTFYTVIVQSLLRVSATDQCKTVETARRLYGNHAVIAHVSAAVHSNHMDTVRHRAALVRRPHRERKAKGVKGKRSKDLHPETEMQDDSDIDQSQGGLMVTVLSPQ